MTSKKQTNQKAYIENFGGFSIKNMNISAKGVFFCTLVEEIKEDASIEKKLSREGDFQYRFININFNREDPYAFVTWPEGVNRALIIYSKNAGGWVSVDFNGGVWEAGVDGFDHWPGYLLPQTDAYQPANSKSSKKNSKSINIPEGLAGGWLSYINELKEIDGIIYACGGIRKVLRREGYNKWIDITLSKDHPQLYQEVVDIAINGSQSKIPSSFKSVDGFSENDIYACGSNGDCWHYDGKTWKRMDIPTNKELNKIVCSEEGIVYIASRDGLIIKGRDAYNKQPEYWELVQADIEALNGQPFEGATFFKGKLYLSTSYALYVLNNKKLERVGFGSSHQFSFQNVASNKNTLISYGPYDALVFNGDTWKTIISSRTST